MQTNQSEHVVRRLAGLCNARMALTAMAIAVMVVALPGCPVVQPGPCDEEGVCDDGDLCTVDMCSNGVDTNGVAVAVCSYEPVECTGDLVCNPDDGECVECVGDADCDDGAFCNGDETCGDDNTCVAGEAPCDPATEQCNEETDTCEAVCTEDADCPDDGNFCTGDPECGADGICGFTGDPCEGGALPVCDEATDACVECLVDADCADGETCADDNTCMAPVAECTSNGDCADDGLFCNGDEFCNTSGAENFCDHTGSPCDEGQTCNEDTDTCSTPGTGFDLTTEDDAITGTTGDDTFTATVGTLNPDDIVVGNGGTDTLNATVAGNASSLATLIDIDMVNFMTLNATTFDAANSAAIGQFAAVSGSTGDLTLDNLEEGTAIRLGAGYANGVTATLANDAAADDELDVEVEGTVEGATFDYVQDGDPVETLNLMVEADSELSPADPTTDFFGDVDATLVTGDNDLTLSGFDATDLAANAIDTSEFEGDLTLSPAADAGLTANFTAGGLAAIEGIDNYVIADTQTFNHVLTLNIGDSPFNIDISNIDEDDLAGNVTVTQSGSERDDTINLTLAGEGDGMGAFAAASTEFLNVASGGTTANAIGNVTINTGVAFTTTTVAVTGDQDLDMGQVVADAVNAEDFTGDLTIDNTGVAGANQIVGGSGDDLLIPGNGTDEVTGGEGVDTFGFDTITANANMNFVLDFVAGEDGDILRFDQATFAEYDGSDITIVDVAGASDAAGVDNEVVVDTAANIATLDTSGGNASLPIAIASDTGDIYYDTDTDGDFADAVVIGNISADQVDDLVPDNFVFE